MFVVGIERIGQGLFDIWMGSFGRGSILKTEVVLADVDLVTVLRTCFRLFGTGDFGEAEVLKDILHSVL